MKTKYINTLSINIIPIKIKHEPIAQSTTYRTNSEPGVRDENRITAAWLQSNKFFDTIHCTSGATYIFFYKTYK